MAAGVTTISLNKELFILVSLLVLASLIVLIFWAPDFRKKGGHRAEIIGGIVLHLVFLVLLALFAAPRIIRETDEIRKIIFPIGNFLFYKIPIFVLVMKWALIIFQSWLGFDLFLEKQYSTGKRLLGIIPVLAVVFNGLLVGVVLLIVMGIIMFSYHFFIKRAESPESRTAPAGTVKQKGPGMVFETAGPSPAVQESKHEIVPPCTSVTLIVPADHISTLKARGGEFSTQLNGKTVNLQDRLLFNGILIAVTRVEPGGPAAITDKTNVSIRRSPDAVIQHCPQCGTIQEKIRETCTNCNAPLPLKKL